MWVEGVVAGLLLGEGVGLHLVRRLLREEIALKRRREPAVSGGGGVSHAKRLGTTDLGVLTYFAYIQAGLSGSFTYLLFEMVYEQLGTNQGRKKY